LGEEGEKGEERGERRERRERRGLKLTLLFPSVLYVMQLCQEETQFLGELF
jgi:hypothetical protein